MRNNILSCKAPANEGFSDIEGIFVEINPRKSKWLLLATFQRKIILSYYIKPLMPTQDLNTTNTNERLMELLDDQGMSNLIHCSACFTSKINPSAIDLIIMNKPKCFQHVSGVSTGLPDFHKAVLRSMTITLSIAVPECIINIHHQSNAKYRTQTQKGSQERKKLS